MELVPLARFKILWTILGLLSLSPGDMTAKPLPPTAIAKVIYMVQYTNEKKINRKMDKV